MAETEAASAPTTTTTAPAAPAADAAPAAPPVVNESVSVPLAAGSDGTISAEAYNALKAQLDARDEAVARLEARNKSLETREREEVNGWLPDVSASLQAKIEESKDDKVAQKDFQQVADYFSKLPQNRGSIDELRPMARTVYAFSADLKRARDENVSSNADKDTIKSLMEENHKLKEDNDKTTKQLKEASDLGAERYQHLQTVQRQMAEAGMVQQKFDFSMSANRYEGNGKAPMDVSAPVDPLSAFVADIRASGEASRMTSSQQSSLLNRPFDNANGGGAASSSY